MTPTLRNQSTPFVELPGNGLADFAPEHGDPAPLLEPPAQTEDEITPGRPVLVMVDAYPDQPHGLVVHEPPPNRHPVRRLVFAIRRAALAVALAPFLVVAWFLLRIWWVARLSVSRSWYGVTSATGWVWSGIVAAITGTVGAVGHLITAIRTAIVRTALAVVTAIRNAIGHTVALVRSAFAAGVRGVFGSAAFVVESAQRAIRSTAALIMGVCQAVQRLVLGAVHATTSSIIAVGQRVLRVITGIRDATLAIGVAGVALTARASRLAAAPFVFAARGLWFIAGRSFRALVVILTMVGFLAWRGVLLVLGGAAIVLGTVVGIMLVGVYGVRIVATTCIALARAVGPASARVGHAAAAGVRGICHGLARGVAAFGSAAHNTARRSGLAAVRLTEGARTTGGQLAHAGAARSAAGLSSAAMVSTRAVHTVWTGAQAATAYSARKAVEHTAALSHVAWERASRVKARVYHESPVVRVNFAAVPARSGDVRVATTLTLVSTAVLTAAVMLIGVGMSLLLRPQTLGLSAPPLAVAASLPAVATPLEPTVAVQRRPELVAPRPPVPAAKAPAAAARRAPEGPATIEPRPAGRSSLTAARVRAIWDKTDTRSLDRAIAAMRSATLAFRRCEMRMTSSDVATATCSELASSRVAWTFDFRRNDDRWLIEGVSTTGAPPVAR
jgi:hypothetical protein